MVPKGHLAHFLASCTVPFARSCSVWHFWDVSSNKRVLACNHFCVCCPSQSWHGGTVCTSCCTTPSYIHQTFYQGRRANTHIQSGTQTSKQSLNFSQHPLYHISLYHVMSPPPSQNQLLEIMYNTLCSGIQKATAEAMYNRLFLKVNCWTLCVEIKCVSTSCHWQRSSSTRS